MRRDYMILSLPNHGTDWLLPILARHGRLRYFEKEYFNPICNARHRERLAEVFGCELVSCYQNIGRPAHVRPAAELAYAETWARENWQLDKENFSPLNLLFFARHFHLALLFRPAESVFPPSRLRVWAWYDAIYHALCDRTAELTLVERAHAAHAQAWHLMRFHAKRLGAPVLDYSVLCTAPIERVGEELDQGWIGDVVNLPAAAREIVATRRWQTKQPASR